MILLSSFISVNIFDSWVFWREDCIAAKILAFSRLGTRPNRTAEIEKNTLLYQNRIWWLSDLYHYFISFICQFVSISIEENKLCRHAIKRYYSCVILSRYPFKYSSRKAVIKVISLGSSFIHFSLLYRPNFFFLILFYSLLLSMFLLHQDKFTTEHNCTFCSRVNDRPRKHDLLSAETYL